MLENQNLPSNEETTQENEGFASLVVTGQCGRDGTSADLSSEHDSATEQQVGSSTDSVEQKDTGERHDDVDGGQDDGENVRVVNASVSSEDRAVVEEEVDTGDLLTDLDENTNHGSE